MPKYLKISLILSTISLILVSLVLAVFLTFNTLKKDLILYLQKNSAGEQVSTEETKRILKKISTIDQAIQITAPVLPKNVSSVSTEVRTIATKLLTEQQKYLVVLQNTDELRATGGFMGSYFVLESDAGQLQPIKIQDIYTPDGQYTGEITAPPGIAEYLSEGKGLRLPNANWWFDLEKSGEQISYFFENTIETNLDGVIFINLTLIEKMLDLTGEIYLPDYQQLVTSSNFAQLARSDRDNFFPGSQEKTNFLNHFLAIFKPKLIEVITHQPQTFIQWLLEQVNQKNIQFYSRDTELTATLTRIKLTTTPTQIKNGLNYFLVESNVGINKANRLVSREVAINLDENQERLRISWNNQNPFAYVNYQRIYISPASELIAVQIDGQTIDLSSILQSTFVDNSGQSWQELALLSSVLGQSQSTVELVLNSKLELKDKKNLALFKQAGLPPTTYQITFSPTFDHQELELRSDQLISFD